MDEWKKHFEKRKRVTGKVNKNKSIKVATHKTEIDMKIKLKIKMIIR